MRVKTMGQLALLAAGLYTALCLLLFAFQERLLFLPNIAGRDLVSTPAARGLAYEDVHFEAADGTRLHGWYIPAEGPGEITVLFFHGNAGNISHRLDSIQLFHQLDLNVFIFDYRGYGQSDGRPTEEGTYLDARAAWHELVESRGEASHRIVLFGRSLGGAIAAWLAAREQPGGLILESTFTSVPQLAQELYPIFPARLLARLSYDTRDELQRATTPVLIVHSPDDEIIPFRHAERLLAAAPEPKRLLPLRGGHNEGFLITGEPYREGLHRFIERHVAPP